MNTPALSMRILPIPSCYQTDPSNQPCRRWSNYIGIEFRLTDSYAMRPARDISASSNIRQETRSTTSIDAHSLPPNHTTSQLCYYSTVEFRCYSDRLSNYIMPHQYSIARSAHQLLPWTSGFPFQQSYASRSQRSSHIPFVSPGLYFRGILAIKFELLHQTFTFSGYCR